MKTTAQSSLDVSVEFKTLVTGTVLLSADGPDDSFMQVELAEPTVMLFQVNFGAGIRSVRLNADDSLADDEWHRIKVVLDTSEISLKVDRSLPQNEPVDSGNLNLKLTSDLYVGMYMRHDLDLYL